MAWGRRRRFPRRPLQPARRIWRAGRLLLRLALVAPLLVMAAIGGALFLSSPDRIYAPHIAGLSAAVEIVLDQDGIPRIRAHTLRDATAALGWLHARERSFQMEAMRRSVAGRLSEIAGPSTLRIDRTMRVLGLRRRAAADLIALPAPTREMLDAYAAGVNAWFDDHGRFSAPELVPFGPPEPWTPVDSLSWGKLMALWLSTNWTTEAARLGALDHIDAEMLLQFWPAATGMARPDQAALAPDAAAARALAAALPRFPAPFTQPDHASDAWAVNGARSATGAPLLAGDPHLGFGFPAIWYLVRIDTPEGVLAGATAPGVPALILGHNGHIAWSFTTTGADTQDLFIEHVLDDGRYATPDGPAAFTTRAERIRVRGAADVTLTVRESRHGPIVSDIDPAPPPGAPTLALAWTALAANDSAASGLLALNRAASVAEARDAAALISAPVQNLLVADRGHIGLFVTGRVPLRRAGDGALPVDGADGAHDWVGVAQGAALPAYVDPPSGVLLNGNEPVAPADFPVALGRDAYGDFRARRMRELLAATPRHELADFAAMQADITSAFVRAVLPALRGVTPPPGLAAQALALLRDWDGRMPEDAPQPLIFNAWTQRLYQMAIARAGVPPAAAPWRELLAAMLAPGGATLCGGDCAGLELAALDQAMAALAAKYGPDPAAWRWGVAHHARFAHPLSAGRSFGTADLAVPGDDTTLFRAGGLADGDFTARFGAEFRGVYDLADLDRSRFVIAPGQSGHWLSRHADDFLSRWHDGATILLDPYPARIATHIRLDPR